MEHELKGCLNSSSQNIAFLSTEVKGSTLKQSTADPAHIPKGYTQAASSKVQTAPNCASHSDEIICSFFAQQASMPTTHDDEDLLQIDEDAMEEIDIRWQVAMLTAKDDWSMELMLSMVQLWTKDGLGDFDWSNKADDITSVTIIDGYKLRGFGVESSSDMESDNSSGNTNSNESLYSNFQKEKGFHSVPPPTGTIIPPRANVSFTGIDELAIGIGRYSEKNKSCQPEMIEHSIFEDWVDSDDEEGLFLLGSPNQKRSFTPSAVSYTGKTQQKNKKNIKSIVLRKGSTMGSQAVLPQNVRVKGGAMINPKQTWRPKGNYLDSVNRNNGSYTLKAFEVNQKKILKGFCIFDSGALEEEEILGKGNHQDILHGL
ncbi:hypothetical protein Tco_0650626 [Tanacetum coccineum]